MAASSVRTSETQDKGEGNPRSVIFGALCSWHFHGCLYLLPLLGFPFSGVLPTVTATQGQSGVLRWLLLSNLFSCAAFEGFAFVTVLMENHRNHWT